MYFQFHDPAHRIGGFLRLANRPNEGRGERTVCLYLPGDTSRLASRDRRSPTIRGSAPAAFGRRSDAVPHLQVGFDGPVNVLSEPASMVNPKAALSTSPVVDARPIFDLPQPHRRSRKRSTATASRSPRTITSS